MHLYTSPLQAYFKISSIAALVIILSSFSIPVPCFPSTTEAIRKMESSNTSWSLSFLCRICSSNQPIYGTSSITRDELGIITAFAVELIVRAALDDEPLVQDYYLIAVAYG